MPTTARTEFDVAIQTLFAVDNREGQALCIYIHRTLYQYRLSKAYTAKDIIVAAYARGIRLADLETSIPYPSAWLRRTAFQIIRHLRHESDQSGCYDLDCDLLQFEGEALTPAMLSSLIICTQVALNLAHRQSSDRS
jgi:hypothetical protein